jgi:hypothetical protein
VVDPAATLKSAEKRRNREERSRAVVDGVCLRFLAHQEVAGPIWLRCCNPFELGSWGELQTAARMRRGEGQKGSAMALCPRWGRGRGKGSELKTEED